MKAGIIGTIWLNTPPEGYGGTEEVVANLVNGLSNKGHQVVLFGPATAKVHAKISPTVTVPLRDKQVDWTNIAYTLYHMTQALDRSDEFDILHVHLNKGQDYVALPLAFHSKKPVIFTLHFLVPSPRYKRGRYQILKKYGALPFTSISDSQRSTLPVNFVKTVYNGLDVTAYPFSNKPQDYFAWLGKIKKEKGTKDAILAAKKAGVQLYVMGVVERGVAENLAYYEKEIKPLIDNKQIIFKENVNQEEKARILGGAKALLNPIAWEEPFGLVMTEAMACGTPVISYARGAAPELIKNEKTGFLVRNIHEMITKIQQVDTIQRATCRKRVEDYFSNQQMILGYEDAYQTVIHNWDTYRENQKKLLATYKDKPADFY